MKKLSFQEVLLKLQNFWSEKGCAILQPYDLEMGAGTFHPATVLRTLDKENWNVAFVQPSRRPTDGRYGIHPNRLQYYYQFQVILKPSPENIQSLYLQSLNELGIDCKKVDVRFVEDDWESPTLGASGLGWEVWLNGMEISQFTYMQQIGGLEIRPVAGEITYGLERLAMYIAEIDDYNHLEWNNPKQNKNLLKYSDISYINEKQFSEYNFTYSNPEIIRKNFEEAEDECKSLIENNLPIPAYDYCIKASHLFNLLEARGVVSATERASYISRVRNLAKICCSKWLEQRKTS